MTSKMKSCFVVAVCIAMAGCAQRPVDCGLVKKQLDGCVKKYRSSREMTLNCFPYSATERISGTWAHTFEFNQFYEDPGAVPVDVDRAFRIQDNPVQLEAVSDELDRTIDPRVNGTDLSQLAQVVFEGRRPLCDFGEGRWLVVDRMISQKILFSRPYGQPG